MIVSVPPNVCIDGDAHGKAGELISGGQVTHGVDPDIDQGHPDKQGSDGSRSNADIQFGQLLDHGRGAAQIDTRGVDYDHHQQEEDTQRQVCGR